MVARVRDIIQRGTTAAQPAATAVDVGTLYYDTTLSKLYRSNGTTWDSVAETTTSSGYAEGTSFPGSPASGDKFFHNTSDMLFYYDGTRWLTTTLYHMPLAGPFDGNATAVNNGWPVTGTQTISRMSLWHTDFAIWLVSLYGSTYTNATNNGSNYWTFSLAGAVTATAYGNFTTAADTAAVHTGHKTALDQAAGSTERGVVLTATRTGTAGSSYGPCGLSYRLIGV